MRIIATVVLVAFVMSCVSTTVVKTTPPDAKVYVDGMFIGNTPVTYSDTKIVGSTTQLRLQKEGCKDNYVILSRSEKFQVGPFIGGLFVLFPFLWVMGYNPEHHYELECVAAK